MPVLNAQYYGKIDLHYINMFMFVIIVKIIENAWLCVARENERSQVNFYYIIFIILKTLIDYM